MPKTRPDPSFALAVLVAATASLSFAPAFAVAAPFAYVTSWTTPSAVSVIDTANNKIVATVPSSGRGPIAANAAGTRVYVASAGDYLSIIDTAANAVVGKVPLCCADVSGVAVNPDGTRAYVAFNQGGMGSVNDNFVSVIDLTMNTVIATLPFAPFLPVGIALNPAGSRMYVPVSGGAVPGGATDGVWVVDTATYAVEAKIALPAGVEMVAMNAAGTRLYVAGWVPRDHSGISIIDTATNAIVATVPLGGAPTNVAVNPAGTRIYVSTYPDSLSIIDAATLAVTTVPVGALPDAVATNPDGTRVYVASFNSNDVAVVDTATNTVITTIPIAAPVDIVVIPAAAGSNAPTETAVEYYYAAWNYYFVTSLPVEISALDAGAFDGLWQRTGETFNVWSLQTGLASPTCRFFSTAFAPKSSHFYTPFPIECAAVKANPSWQFESIAFYVQIPTGYGTGNGSCPQGTTALYRAYNNGMGGAPNHRYTTSLATLNTMLAQGWVFEGEANTKVFACVPQ